MIMRNYPEDESDWKDLEDMGVAKDDWKVEVLRKNPNYTAWGNNEDYMCSDSNSGWSKCVELYSVKDLFKLDDLNELVNFYFYISRASEDCKYCNGTGYNKETEELYDSWYDFDNKGTRLCDSLTQDEIDLLWEEKRIQGYKEKPTAEVFNNDTHKFLDSIDHYLCVKQRAKRLGVYGLCDKCEGKGFKYTEPMTQLHLQMWILHPRKSASRGVRLHNISEKDLPEVIDYLKQAQFRNIARFSKL